MFRHVLADRQAVESRDPAQRPELLFQRQVPVPALREHVSRRVDTEAAGYPAVDAQELDQLQLEKAALQRAFDHFDELEMDGLLLSDGERIIAFSMGSRMNRDYYDVGFEKAFPDVNGAYAMINREFSRMIAEKYPEVRFLNREDDMGSEGLRRAKESYQPTVLLEKYTADWKEN